MDACFYFNFHQLITWYVLTFIIVSYKNRQYVKFRHFEPQYYFIYSYDMKTSRWKGML